MSEAFAWIISITLVLFWLIPIVMAFWVIWEVARRLRRGEAGH